MQLNGRSLAARETWEDVRRLLVVRLDNIGDVVMLGPALRALRQALPKVAITLLASPAGARVAPLLPWVNDTLVLRALWQDASGALPFSPAREQMVVETLRFFRFDAAIVFTSFSQSPYPPAYACYLAGIPIRVGQSRDFGGGVLSHWVKPPPDDTHQVDRNLHLLDELGIPAARRDLELIVPEVAQRAAEQLLTRSGLDPGSPYIVVAPGASCPARTYDPVRFAAVVHTLVEQTGLPIVVVGRESERKLAEPILAATREPQVVSLVGMTSVAELAAIIQRAGLVLANDSGPMHIAEAFRRPMVVLFSGTELESQWAPRNSPAVLLRRPTSCTPCYAFHCPYQMECLDVPPAEVVSAALDLLNGTLALARGPVASPTQRRGDP